jgi:hypothetical protein
MTLATLFKFLIGNRQAILAIAASRSSVFVGLLFVLAAGLAREYDGEDLRSEPWHLLLPLGASLVTSALLYMLLKALLWIRGGEADGRKLGYQELLSLYWMTAPLALLYGIPVERFLSAGDATRANLALLGIVSVWRVLLMTRAISVLYCVSFFLALFPVMLFADSVALALLSQASIPILAIMGGVRLSESERLISEATLTTMVLGFYSWPVWLAGAISAVSSKWQLADFRDAPPQRASRAVWLVAALAGPAWLFPMLVTQREQHLRQQVESLLRSDQVCEGLKLMSAHERADFPPHWEPPPRLAYQEAEPDMADVMECLVAQPGHDWVLEIFTDKFINSLRGSSPLGVWYELGQKEIERRVAILEHLLERQELIEKHADDLESILDDMPSPHRERIQGLLKEAQME